MRGTWLASWERSAEIPLLVAGVVFLVAYAMPVLRPGHEQVWFAVGATAWALFVVDYLVRLALAARRWEFVRRNPLDLLILLLPLLRPLKLVRLIGASGMFRRRFQGRVLAYAGLTTLLLGSTAALSVLAAERAAPGSTITTFGDAVWWTVTTLSTVGYGDTYPVTTYGRLVGVGLMSGGVALFGVVTASFASWFTARVQDTAQADATTQALLTQTLTEVRALHARLDALTASSPPGESVS